ncbi:MAG TPA: hypothetical protein VN951_13765 [Pyrinomonadaceae bacterium]|nr:hypothetical protein [Pyrinomonadaceae bacterium]
MNKTDCRNVRRELEEAATGELLSTPVREHLTSCASCAKFGDEQQELRNMVASVGTVEAPADFDFKLRARLASSRSARRDLLSGYGFGNRSVAFATLVLLLGFAVIVMNVRSRSTASAPAAQANGPASESNSKTAPLGESKRSEQARQEVAGTTPTNPSNPTDVQTSTPVRKVTKGNGSSVPQYAVARNGRVKATDLSATPAPVLRPTETAMGWSVFPLGTSYQSLKVSVDDGRGSSRTISLPTVSFGSSRVLARNPTPVNAALRDSW